MVILGIDPGLAIVGWGILDLVVNLEQEQNLGIKVPRV